MSNDLKKTFLSPHAIIVYFLLVLSLLIGLNNSNFFSLATVFSLSRAMIVTTIFAMGQLLVIITGGIDVSFPAIANLALYASATAAVNYGVENIWVLLLLSLAIGLFFGTVNALLIARFNVPPLIATLGLSSVVSGATLAYLGTDVHSRLPESITNLGKATIYTYTSPAGTDYQLNALVLVPLIICVLMYLFLKYTRAGRSFYIFGGDPEAAYNTGFKTQRIQASAYIISGLLAGIGGFVYMALMGTANPNVLMGSEMLVIAAVIIGGGRLTGGHGSVIGTVLGVLLIALIQNNLVMLGVPTHFQTFIIGSLIIAFVVINAMRERNEKETVIE